MILGNSPGHKDSFQEARKTTFVLYWDDVRENGMPHSHVWVQASTLKGLGLPSFRAQGLGA